MSEATPAFPAALGRGVIVSAGVAPPAAWAGAERVAIGPSELEDPATTVDRLHAAWSEREPVVVELGVDPSAFREPQVVDAQPWSLDPSLDLPLDRLHFLVWANNYDARDGDPVWWWSKKAARAGLDEGTKADILLPDGSDAWVDGGPRWTVPAAQVPESIVHSSSVEVSSATTVPPVVPAPDVDLASDQLAAVTHVGGPVRVIAPAGSGKTRVLTERMRRLLADHGYENDQVLAVAYNKQAQQELEARLFRLQPRTRTLNSLGYRVVTEHRGTRPRLIDESEVRNLVGDLFPIPRQRRANTDPVGPYLDALTQVRLGLRDPEDVEAGRDDVPGLAERFSRYRSALAERGGVDFDEQIYSALEALLRDGGFRRRIQVEHRHLLVDEFQDLTPAHVLMVRLLAMPAFDVFGVGDDDQTIYDHAGADPRFLVDYADFFPGSTTEALEVNYRCSEPIVEAARTLLGYNELRVDKRITVASGAPDGQLGIHRSTQGEAAADLTEVVRSWTAEDVDPAAIAVLARVNSMLLAPQIALWDAGVPVRSTIRPEILDRTGLSAALAWLRVATDPQGLIPNDLEEIRRRPSRGFPMWISKWFVNCRTLSDLRGVASRIDDDRVAGKVDDLADDIELIAAAASRGAPTRQLLEIVRDRIGLGGAMEMLDGSKGSQAAASHLDDLEGLIEVADIHPDPDTFEPWLRAALVESSGSEGVTLSTVHRVKGREWDRVAVYGVNSGLFPHRLSEDWEAERRVLHVAITRARDVCAVIGDAERGSPFLAELTGEAERAAARPVSAGRGAGRSPAAGPAIEPQPGARDAESALRDWRRRRSDGDRVPAFVVLSNSQLEAVAAAMPEDARALLACPGIGPTRLERYGDEILAVIDSVRRDLS